METRILGTLVLLISALIGCGRSQVLSDEPTVVTTIDPFRAIIEPVTAGRARVVELLPSGASPHTYEPRPSDLRTVTSAFAFFYGARQLDGWAARMGRSVEMFDWVPDSLQLQSHDHAHTGADPHFWMDPGTVEAILPALTDTLCSLDEAGCAAYRANAERFSIRLHVLDDSLKTLLSPVRGKAILLSHPFLGYFARRYGLVVAGIVEEIPGSEPSPQDMQRMVQEARNSDAAAIFTQPQLPARAARAVAEVVGLPVIELNPLGTGSGADVSYEELLYYNARKIVSALASSEADLRKP